MSTRDLTGDEAIAKLALQSGRAAARSAKWRKKKVDEDARFVQVTVPNEAGADLVKRVARALRDKDVRAIQEAVDVFIQLEKQLASGYDCGNERQALEPRDQLAALTLKAETEAMLRKVAGALSSGDPSIVRKAAAELHDSSFRYDHHIPLFSDS